MSGAGYSGDRRSWRDRESSPHSGGISLQNGTSGFHAFLPDHALSLSGEQTTSACVGRFLILGREEDQRIALYHAKPNALLLSKAHGPTLFLRHPSSPWVLPRSSVNTPTGVGKIKIVKTRGQHARKHPHGRGEDSPERSDCFICPETPPRAWGRLLRGFFSGGSSRNTPTGVGKTNLSTAGTVTPGKHPHGRGEDLRSTSKRRSKEETPPRAWGRLIHVRHRLLDVGNTPTGVGKTFLYDSLPLGLQKHPHGRGEDER